MRMRAYRESAVVGRNRDAHRLTLVAVPDDDAEVKGIGQLRRGTVRLAGGTANLPDIVQGDVEIFVDVGSGRRRGQRVDSTRRDAVQAQGRRRASTTVTELVTMVPLTVPSFGVTSTRITSPLSLVPA
jgi:hypothetical protein